MVTKFQIFRSHAVVKFNSKKIAIKTERDVQIRLQVKKEPNASNKSRRIKTDSIPIGWEKEKRKLIEQILALKTENQQNHLALKKTESDHAKILVEKQNLEQTLAENNMTFSLQMDKLRFELTNAKDKIIHNKVSSDKIISDLKREIQLLLARNKQLQTGMEHRKSANTTTSTTTDTDSTMLKTTENDYEVEKILAHKNTKAGQTYLIRWKGYGSDEDSWEKVANLNCPKILKEYLHSINKKNSRNHFVIQFKSIQRKYFSRSINHFYFTSFSAAHSKLNLVNKSLMRRN